MCVCAVCERERGRKRVTAQHRVCVREGEDERGGGSQRSVCVCLLVCMCERERERLSHSAASCVCVREKERGRERGPVPNGTLNPRGLPLSPHFRDVMLLWLSGRNLLQSLPQCELGRSADRGHITAAKGAHANTLLNAKIRNGTS